MCRPASNSPAAVPGQIAYSYSPVRSNQLSVRPSVKIKNFAAVTQFRNAATEAIRFASISCGDLNPLGSIAGLKGSYTRPSLSHQAPGTSLLAIAHRVHWRSMDVV